MTRQELVEFLKELLDLDELTRMIDSQITGFMQRGYLAKNIARSVFFYIEVKKNTYDAQYGIGIVPHIHDDAVRYFNNLKRREDFLEHQRQELIKFLEEKPERIKAAPKFGRRGVVQIDISSIGKKEVE